MNKFKSLPLLMALTLSVPLYAQSGLWETGGPVLVTKSVNPVTYPDVSKEITADYDNMGLKQAEPQGESLVTKMKRSFLSFSLYFPTPAGDYKSTDINNEKAGFAKGGFGYGLEGAFMFHPYIGIGGIWAGYANGFNMDEYHARLKKEIGNGSYRIETKADPHAVGVFMVGPNLSLPLKKMTFDLKLYVGNMAYRFPKIKTDVTSGANRLTVEYNDASTNNFGYNVGVAARIRLSKRLSFRPSVDYVSGNMKMDIRATYSENGVRVKTEVTNNKFAVSMVNIGLGLAFQFNRED